MNTTPDALAAELVAFTVTQLEALVERHFPDLRVPRVFAGHPVEPDVRADLAFTVGLLHEAGVRSVAGTPVEDALATILRPIDGKRTHSFFSYRVAETLGRFGDYASNPLLRDFDEAERTNVADACDSTSFVELLTEGLLPRNYAAVLARCELGRQRLGLVADGAQLEGLIARTRSLLDENPLGYVDDSQSGVGRYDIYTADIHLFTEPFADRLGSAWERGARASLALVERICTRDGTAFPWGRSTGALGACLTLELAGLGLRRGLAERPSQWLQLGLTAFGAMPGWFSDGLITAHQHRSTFGYRGPHRRLQMTLDCLGKLVDSALALQRSAPAGDGKGDDDPFGPRDELVALEERRPAAVWTYRSPALAFVLPLVGSTVSDYLPSPRNPGLFEVPVERDLPTGVPVALRGGNRYTAGEVPTAVEKRAGGLVVEHEGFPRSGQFERSEKSPLAGRRRAAYRVEHRTLHVEEELSFDTVPDAVALQVAETAGRPLDVRFACATPHAVTSVDVAGLKEYRSFWSELTKVHQIDVDPAASLRFSWSVTPKLRVMSTAHGHHYHRTLYDPLADRVLTGRVPYGRLLDPAARPSALAHWDQFHLHWPEWFVGADVAVHRDVIDGLVGAGVRIVWTQHNLVPHSKDEGVAGAYEAWAAAADAVIHHSEWGRKQVLARYRFRTDAVHRVIPHPHFGNLIAPATGEERRIVESELGLRSDVLRLGIVGAPRAEKDVQLVMDAVAACDRDDVELLVLSGGPSDRVPDDPRVVALPYEMVEREVYDRRLRALDCVVLPFHGGEMLTTGVVGDVVALGLPALVSDWEFLAEILGGGGIPYGTTRDDLTACVEGLDAESLAAAAEASGSLQARYDPRLVAEETYALLDGIGSSRI